VAVASVAPSEVAVADIARSEAAVADIAGAAEAGAADGDNPEKETYFARSEDAQRVRCVTGCAAAVRGRWHSRPIRCRHSCIRPQYRQATFALQHMASSRHALMFALRKRERGVERKLSRQRCRMN